MWGPSPPVLPALLARDWALHLTARWGEDGIEVTHTLGLQRFHCGRVTVPRGCSLDGCAPSLSVWPSGARRKRRRRLRPRRRPSGRWPRVSLPGFSAKTVGRERCGSETSLEMGASPPLLCPRSSCSGAKRALARTDVVLSPPLRPRGVCVHEKRKVSKRKTTKRKGKRSKKK